MYHQHRYWQGSLTAPSQATWLRQLLSPRQLCQGSESWDLATASGSSCNTEVQRDERRGLASCTCGSKFIWTAYPKSSTSTEVEKCVFHLCHEPFSEPGIRQVNLATAGGEKVLTGCASSARRWTFSFAKLLQPAIILRGIPICMGYNLSHCDQYDDDVILKHNHSSSQQGCQGCFLNPGSSKRLSVGLLSSTQHET